MFRVCSSAVSASQVIYLMRILLFEDAVWFGLWSDSISCNDLPTMWALIVHIDSWGQKEVKKKHDFFYASAAIMCRSIHEHTINNDSDIISYTVFNTNNTPYCYCNSVFHILFFITRIQKFSVCLWAGWGMEREMLSYEDEMAAWSVTLQTLLQVTL